MSRSNLSSRRRGGAKRKPDRAQPQEKIGEIFRPEEFRRTDQRVRRWPSRRLPFVAAGVDSPDLPACIFHAPGDPAVIAPEEGRYRNLLSWPRSTKAFQSNKAESIEDFVVELQMVTTAFRLGFHAAEPHANPAIQAIERRPASEEPRCKVSSSTPNNPVKFIHLSLIQIELAASEFSHLVFKFLHRLGPHAPRTAGEDKP